MEATTNLKAVSYYACAILITFYDPLHKDTNSYFISS